MAVNTTTPSQTARFEDIHPENYHFLQNYVYRESGIVLDGDKHYLIEARLMPIVHEMRMTSLNNLCEALRASSQAGLKQQVIDAMTTNETFFFRDPAQYDALRTSVLPPLIAERQTSRTLSFWSAAASSGQEAYSLAMMLLQMGLGGWDIRLQGTDLSTRMLERARRARYLQIEVNRGLPVSYLIAYFNPMGLEWQLKDEVRNMVDFQLFDLRQNMSSFGPFDVIFCRNVLIYFDLESKRKILSDLRSRLRPGGYLLLGGSESTLNLDNQLTPRTFGQAVLHQAP